MKAVDRPHRWITVNHVLDRTRMEIRVHCAEPRCETPMLLDATEARALAHSLLTMADELVAPDIPAVRPFSVNGPVVTLPRR